MNKSVIAGVLCVILLLVLCFAVPDSQILWEAGDALYTGGELQPLTWKVFPYGAGLAISAVLAWVVSFCLERHRVSLKDALSWFVGALAFGLLFSRLLYCVVDTAYYNPKWLVRLAALRLWDGGMAMIGVLLGALLAVKMIPEGAAIMPVAMPLFIAGARFAEGFTQMGYGPSVSFEGVFSRQVGYAVRLNVSLIETIVALVIFTCILLLPYWAEKRGSLNDGKRISAFLLLYGLTQIFMESLRRDRHMIWGFTKAQQIMAIVMVFVLLMMHAKGKKEKRSTLIMTLCTVLPIVGLEFAIDRADVPILLLYSVYLLILAAYLRYIYAVFCRSLR